MSEASSLDVLDFLKTREADAFRAWKSTLDDLLVKQEAWEQAKRAYHDELAARRRLAGVAR